VREWRSGPRSLSNSLGGQLLTRVIPVLVFYVGTANAQQSQPSRAPQNPPSCLVKRTDDDEAALAYVRFSGKVRRGESYQCAFIQGLTFLLAPIEDGWLIEIREDGDNDDLAEPEAPFSDRNPLKIVGGDFGGAGEKAASASTTKTLPDERKFKVPGLPGGQGSVQIMDVKLDGQRQGEIEEMSFEVVIEIRALQGIPIYGGHRGRVTPPKAAGTPDPEYPQGARGRFAQGIVVLYLTVDVDGRPRNIRVVRSLESDFDAAAINAVRRWKFKPATKDGKPVPVEISVQVQFRPPGPF